MQKKGLSHELQKWRKCDSPFIIQIIPSFFFSFIEEKKKQKEELFWKSWVFRTLRSPGQGVAPTPYHLLKKVDENF